jgi:hypothetical protein
LGGVVECDSPAIRVQQSDGATTLDGFSIQRRAENFAPGAVGALHQATLSYCELLLVIDQLNVQMRFGRSEIDRVTACLQGPVMHQRFGRKFAGELAFGGTFNRQCGEPAFGDSR